MSDERKRPTPNHYWDMQTMSWKLRGDRSELNPLPGSATIKPVKVNGFWKVELIMEGKRFIFEQFGDDLFAHWYSGVIKETLEKAGTRFN